MRRILGVSILAVSIALTGAVQGEDWFRLNMSSPIAFDGGGDVVNPPNPGENTPIEIVIDEEQVSGRVYGTMTIPITVSGVDATHSYSVADLPGASWVSDSAAYGTGNVVWPSATQGTHRPTFEVRDAGGDIVATAEIEIVVYAPLTAAVSQAVYEVDVGDELTIVPTTTNAIGAVQWGSAPSDLPEWLELDEDTGIIRVDTTSRNAASNLVLTAVDQADRTSAPTSPFDVAVVGDGTCVWQLSSSPELNPWSMVTFGNGLFVAVASTGTNRVMTSPDGQTWTHRSVPDGAWRGVTYGGGQFVAVGSAGTFRVMTSPDGITWTGQSAAQANAWRDVEYGNGRFVAVSNDGSDRVMTSTDGATWASRSAPANGWYSLVYGNGLFAAVAINGNHRVMTSPDGITWTGRPAAPGDWYSVTHGDGKFASVATAGDVRLMTSADGISWVPDSSIPANDWRSIAYGDGRFIATAISGGERILNSTDAEVWTATTAPASNQWISVGYGNGRFVSVSNTGTSRAMWATCD